MFDHFADFEKFFDKYEFQSFELFYKCENTGLES